ncbi:ASNSD1 upstream open reading frame protein-like [Argopecten irradians]|uniref:ASNSD1 upstream open reading frame protein-like n=1 Tax=Argopecten irradians TaxID=31199 RepID=UPI003716B17B
MDHQEKKLQLRHQIKEKEVLQSELSTLKKEVKVYKQQQNSNVFFLASKDNVFSECKRTLDNLVQEYKDVEASEPSEDQGEGET